MKKTVYKNTNGLKGEITIPSDKSISHRAAMFSSLAKGTSIIKNFSNGQDPLSTLSVCKTLGIDYEFKNNSLIIKSTGKLSAPHKNLDCGNSGTTMRLMSGILAGQNFASVLTGDESLTKRPMRRVIEPLTLMGAKILSTENHAPLKITGAQLNGINYISKLASAQVKSCVLLAGMYANGCTSFTEPSISRDHTERMLEFMGADIIRNGITTTIKKSELSPQTIEIPGDISSAAYFLTAGLIIPHSDIILKNVGTNETRTGILDVVEKMGAEIEYIDERFVSGEKVSDIRVKSSELKGSTISGDIIPRLIDEIPIIAVLATQAEGETKICDAKDLRNKESDRIKTVVKELRKLGAEIEELDDGMIIRGKTELKGGVEVETYDDHRLAMSLYIAGLLCDKPISINGFEWASVSFPDFEEKFIGISL